MMGIWSLTTTAAAAALSCAAAPGCSSSSSPRRCRSGRSSRRSRSRSPRSGSTRSSTSLLYVRLLYGVSLDVEDWLAFIVAVPVVDPLDRDARVPARRAFVRFRSAWAVGNLFEFPVWTICGLLIPIAVLPAGSSPSAWVFAPTWGMNALRDAALGAAHRGTTWRCASRSRSSTARSGPSCSASSSAPRDGAARWRSREHRLRVFAIGGFLSYRALFGWLNPYLFVIILLVPSVTQILFFAYLGRAAGVEDDSSTSSATPRRRGRPVPLRDGRHDHRRALYAHALAPRRLAREPARALPRPRRARRRQRRGRRRVRLRRRLAPPRRRRCRSTRSARSS